MMNKKRGFHKIIVATIMVGSLLQVGTRADAEEQVAIQLAAASIHSYKDFDANAHWASAMQWAIDKGIISGYQNQKHPTDSKKGVGNWLNPNGRLTEYQMLTMILKYYNADLLASEKAYTSKTDLDQNFAFAEYTLAEELGIVTKGSTANVAPASQQVTRGQMAQALVSLHYGQSVTLEQAVEFMYANNLTTGKDPAKGQTLANFGAADKLTRTQMVVFLERHATQRSMEIETFLEGLAEDIYRRDNGLPPNPNNNPFLPMIEEEFLRMFE